ncbi:hypothetical protein BS47DRAFT_1369679 [Hydnum rufescens UP504]|uniref:Uncharacterized protein n=1 Tax=Hydnum rufescens UP504 TaxID=1448309 RepID=A0A9P6ACM0_9AGAM|nr:hypothetical protein BS47DRAFT_1369679 [Hydnum rufescens UP504]
METADVTVVNIFGGSFFGNLITALSVSSSLKDGHGSTDLTYLADASVAFLCVCTTQSLYWWFVANYHNSLAPGRATWEFLIYQINTTFFAHGVYSLSANLYVGVLVQVLVFLQFVTAIKANLILDFRVMVRECRWFVVSWLTIQFAKYGFHFSEIAIGMPAYANITPGEACYTKPHGTNQLLFQKDNAAECMGSWKYLLLYTDDFITGNNEHFYRVHQGWYFYGCEQGHGLHWTLEQNSIGA